MPAIMKAFHITHWALPCMRGATTSITSRAGVVGVEPAGQLVGVGDGLGTPAAPSHGGEEDVLLAPQDPLGHPGGAAGVEDVEVVRGPWPEVRAPGEAESSADS